MYHILPILNRSAGQHAVRGATKEKSRKLDELKARRKAKDEKKRVLHSYSLVLKMGLMMLLRSRRTPRGETAHLRQWTWRQIQKTRKMARSVN